MLIGQSLMGQSTKLHRAHQLQIERAQHLWHNDCTQLHLLPLQLSCSVYACTNVRKALSQPFSLEMRFNLRKQISDRQDKTVNTGPFNLLPTKTTTQEEQALRRLTFKWKRWQLQIILVMSLIHTSHTKHKVLDLFNVYSIHALLNCSGQEFQKTICS